MACLLVDPPMVSPRTRSGPALWFSSPAYDVYHCSTNAPKFSFSTVVFFLLSSTKNGCVCAGTWGPRCLMLNDSKRAQKQTPANSNSNCNCDCKCDCDCSTVSRQTDRQTDRACLFVCLTFDIFQQRALAFWPRAQVVQVAQAGARA